MRPSPVPFLAALLAVAPALGQERAATLVNFTGRPVRLTFEAPIGSKGIAIVATLDPARPDPDRTWTDPGALDPLTLDLPHCSQLRFSHGEASGVRVWRMFDLTVAFADEAKADPAPGAAARPEPPAHLSFGTEPAWFGWGPDRPWLSANYWPHVQARPLRFTRCGAWLLFLELAEDPVPAPAATEDGTETPDRPWDGT